MSEEIKIAKAARDYCNINGSFYFEYSDESNEIIDAFEAGYAFANVKQLEAQLKEANYTINSLIHHFHRYGMDEESLVILMEVEKAKEYLTKYKVKE